jgi:hypothetical protein
MTPLLFLTRERMLQAQQLIRTENVPFMSSILTASRTPMLCASRKFLKVVGATAAFPVILGAQATTSLTQKKEFHM